MAEIKVGQTMVLAKRQSYTSQWTLEPITITKVGRLYGHFGSDQRFSLATGKVDDTWKSWVFASREEFAAEMQRWTRWKTLCERMDRFPSPPPRHITTQMIERAAAALEIEL